jgi:predicted transposase/invertase (TIGR01784 family)
MTFITTGERIGMRKGKQEAEQRVVLSMLKKGVSVEDIAKFTELTIEQVRKIQFEEK